MVQFNSTGGLAPLGEMGSPEREAAAALRATAAQPSRVLSRWERRLARLQDEGSAPATPRNTGSSVPKTPSSACRFIPQRSSNDVDREFQRHHMMNGTKKENASPQKFASCLAKALFQGPNEEDSQTVDSHKVLKFANKPPVPAPHHQNNMRVVYTANKAAARGRQASLNTRPQRVIPSTAERVLDAPDLMDDFYVNLLDWSSTNLLAVGLGPAVYLWDAATGAIDLLLENDEADLVTSLKWMRGGTHLAVGTQDHTVQLWDVSRQQQVRAMGGHSSRVSALAWNEHVLASGSRDAAIYMRDVRAPQDFYASARTHQQEVCGLAWSPDGDQLASGGNDNVCAIWEAAQGYDKPRHVLSEHTAAVKALAWSPHTRNLLATGGGTADRHIRFWNSSTGALLQSVDTRSQVCGLVWNPHEKELLSAHGFSQNQLTLWKYPTMTRQAELKGHTSRVLHLALSPDGTTVCSAAADETLRFWKVFEAAPPKSVGRAAARKSSKGKLGGISIR